MKTTAPTVASEDRSFVIFYKQAAASSGSTFTVRAVYTGENIDIPEKQMAVGYRTYASGYPKIASPNTSC